MRKIPACREIIRLAAIGCSDKKISEITGNARVTVKKIREQAKLKGISWPLEDSMDDENIYYTLFPPKEYSVKKRKPDLEYVYHILTEDPVKANAYRNYRQQCAENGETPVKYNWFCELVNREKTEYNMANDCKLKPGEIAVVSWMEHSVKLLDNKDDKAYIVIGFLPFSQYVFVRAYKDRGIKTWVDANSKMLLSFGGVPNEIVVSGTKNGVTKGVTDRKYTELIEHYGVIQVKNNEDRYEVDTQEVLEWFENHLSDRRFETLAHLNEELERLRTVYLGIVHGNGKTREQIFLSDEKHHLRRLPEDVFVAKVKKPAKIQRNCHVSYLNRYYSVPYQFLLQGKKEVELEVTNKKVSIYYKDNLIAEHPNMIKSYERSYSTRLEHMPSDEKEQLLEWNKEFFLNKAATAGKNTRRVIEALMGTKPIRQQTYRVCDMILRLGTEYTKPKLEAACAKIRYVNNGSVYMTIKDELEQSKKGGK